MSKAEDRTFGIKLTRGGFVKLIIRLMLATAMLVLVVAPVAAAPQRVDTLPAITPFTKARFDFALTLFGFEVGYGKGVIESPTRLHLAIEIPSGDGSPSQVVEAILYDGVFYTRENNDTQWYIEPVGDVPVPENPVPATASSTDGPALTLMGTRDVAGVMTDQYQIWINGDDRSALTTDLFIGQTLRYLDKFQISLYADGRDTTPLLGFDYRWYDFDNAALKVYPPQGAVVRQASASMSVVDGLKTGLVQLERVMRWQKR
jgi:hypothetical protein